MSHVFDLLVFLALFAPMGLLVALNIATLRPPLRPGMPQPPLPAPLSAARDERSGRPVEEELREAA